MSNEQIKVPSERELTMLAEVFQKDEIAFFQYEKDINEKFPHIDAFANISAMLYLKKSPDFIHEELKRKADKAQQEMSQDSVSPGM